MKRGVLALALALATNPRAELPAPPPFARIADGLLRLELDPANAPVLLEIARAYHDAGQPALARHYLARVLALDPTSTEALDLLARSELALGDLESAAARFARLRQIFPDRPEYQQDWPSSPPVPPPPSGWFWVGTGYLSTLVYHGDTPRESSAIHEATIRAGRLGSGYASAGLVRTDVRLRGVEDDTQWEVKAKVGWMPRPDVLAHAGLTLPDSESSSFGEAWVAGLGVETLGPRQHHPSAHLFFQERPDGHDTQVNLAQALSGPRGSVSLASAVQVNQDGDWAALPRAEARAALSEASQLVIGAAAGRMRHEVRGFHDVLYNQDDLHVYSGSLRLIRNAGRFRLEGQVGLDGYETDAGGNYRAISAVIGLHAHAESLRQASAASVDGWTWSAGPTTRGLDLAWSTAAPNRLIDAPVAPIRIGAQHPHPGGQARTFYEDGAIVPDFDASGRADGRSYFSVADIRQLQPDGAYYQRATFRSRELAYSLRSDLPAATGSSDEGRIGGRITLESPPLTKGLPLRFSASYAQQGFQTAHDDLIGQTVVETETRNDFSYPVSADFWVVHDPVAFQRFWQPLEMPSPARFGSSAHRRDFASYEGRRSTSLEGTLHDLSLAASCGWTRSRVSLRLQAGPVVTVTEGSFNQQVAWRERGQETVLRVDTRDEHDQEVLLGAEIGLALRWQPWARQPWFVEAGTLRHYGKEPRLLTGNSETRLHRESWSAFAAVGLGL